MPWPQGYQKWRANGLQVACKWRASGLGATRCPSVSLLGSVDVFSADEDSLVAFWGEGVGDGERDLLGVGTGLKPPRLRPS